MSEKQFKAPREIAEIQGEYQSLCTKAGHLQYQIAIMQKDLSLVNDSLRDLNFEAAASNQAAIEKRKKEDEAKAAAESAAKVPEAPKMELVKNEEVKENA